jgi:hypothetical protein
MNLKCYLEIQNEVGDWSMDTLFTSADSFLVTTLHFENFHNPKEKPPMQKYSLGKAVAANMMLRLTHQHLLGTI